MAQWAASCRAVPEGPSLDGPRERALQNRGAQPDEPLPARLPPARQAKQTMTGREQAAGGSPPSHRCHSCAGGRTGLET